MPPEMDFIQVSWRCVFQLMIILSQMSRIIDVAGGSFNGTNELTNDTYSTTDIGGNPSSPYHSHVYTENEILKDHKAMDSKKQFYPCPELCKCDRRQNKYSEGLLLYTADCSRCGLKQVPQVMQSNGMLHYTVNCGRLGFKSMFAIRANEICHCRSAGGSQY